MAHAVVRTDKLAGTKVRSELVSVRYQQNGEVASIDNGNIVKLGNLEDGVREVYQGFTPSETDTISDIVLIASPEKIYNNRVHGLDAFTNADGAIARGYRLHEHDIFSVTADALDGEPDVGKFVAISNGTKISVSDDDGFGVIIDKNIVDRYTYWVIEIGGSAGSEPPVPPTPHEYVTTLFTDGTLIINEDKANNRSASIAAHGEVVKEYEPGPYTFTGNREQPWASDNESILSVEFGSEYAPTSMAFLFSSMYWTTSVDFTNLDTSNVTSMADMFLDCESVNNLDFSGLDTSNVTTMIDMFAGALSLTSLNISDLDTSKVTNMSNMFESCEVLEAVDVSGFDTSKVETMHKMFCSCGALTSIDVSSFDTGSVTDMSEMFANCDLITELNLTSFDTSSVTDMSMMFQYDSGLTTIFADTTFDVTNVTNSENMFRGCVELVGGAGTTYDSSYTDKTYAKIDGGTGNYGYFTSPFATTLFTDGTLIMNENKLMNREANVAEHGAVTNEYPAPPYDFVSDYAQPWQAEMSSVLAVEIENEFSMSNMNYLFYSLTNATTIDLTNLDTSEATSMNSMFANCRSVTSLDLSGFDTSNVTGMSYMFYRCTAIETLDVSSFDTSSVTDMTSMFSNCSNLTTIYASDLFDTELAASSTIPFSSCRKLVGGAGTTYHDVRNTIANARIDNPPDEPGYFTAKE